MSKRCIMTCVYSNSKLTQRMAYRNGSRADLILVKDSDFSRYEVMRGIELDSMDFNNYIPVNYTFSEKVVTLLGGAEILDFSESIASWQTDVVERATIWSLLIELIEADAMYITESGNEIHSRYLSTSRSTDNVLLRYPTEFGYRVEKVLNLKDANDGASKIRFRVEPSKVGKILLKHARFVVLKGNELTVRPEKVNYLAFNREDFHLIANPSLIVLQQSVLEYYKKSRLAGWFAHSAAKEIFDANEAGFSTPSVKRNVQRDRPTVLFDVHTDAISRAEMKGLLYGVSSKFVLSKLAKLVVRGGEESDRDRVIHEYLSELIPQTNRYNGYIVDEVSSLLSGLGPDYNDDIFKRYFKFCDTQLAIHSMRMYMFKCLMQEYDYYPSSLLRGFELQDTRLTIKRGG